MKMRSSSSVCRGLSLLALLLSVAGLLPSVEADEGTCASPTCESKPVALFADPSQVNSLVDWIITNSAFLTDQSFLAPESLVYLLKFSPRMYWVQMDLQPISDEIFDIQVAAQVISGDVGGVVFFSDASAAPTADLKLIERACIHSQVPLALNKATADLALRGITKKRTAYLIFNPVAGQGNPETDLALIRSILEPQIVLNVVLTQKDREAADQATEIVNMIKASPEYTKDPKSSSAIIIASGGDGTVSAIAGATMGTGIPFGAIPRGTANAFSVALGIPTAVDQACYNILSGHVRVIDGGMCNDTPFINLAGVGFEAGLVENATRELKNYLGNLAYVLGGAKQSLQQEPFKCVIEVDGGEKQTIQTKVVTVANVAPSSSLFAQGFGEVIPDDGMFEVTIATGTDKMGELDALATLWINSVVKTKLESDNVLRLRAKSITVDSDPPQKLLLDGEVLEENPVTFKIVENGLTVITPAPEKS